MDKKVAFLHTVVSLAERLKKLIAETLSEVKIFHIVDESLLQDMMSVGRLTPSIVRRLCYQVVLAREAGANLIMVCCSSISPGVDVARQIVDVPVLKIDDPMAEKAVEIGDTIGVLSTASTTLTNSSELVKSKAELKGRPVKIKSILCQEAFQALIKGNTEQHDRLAMEAALQLAKNTDVVVLAQASMSHLACRIQKETKTPILTSPTLAIAAIRRTLGIES
ncbi:Asp/Glu/hydantoin racemase [Candidatus Aerophobetes bacterium]|uniref:Asp/Glu/hydantoin racemase n=1 Tax=Aerophobetes bacterium TaxID=2030807 RepID=A0A523TIQ3_UNCAE|nr:MAG: Asp/Glu/hydantoin racemase [Candidatus Aerophobetes bacterium]